MRIIEDNDWLFFIIRDEDDNLLGWKEGTPPEVIKQYEEEMKLREKGIMI